jgi:anti-sigma regulatory factor (Ser/Thr protein kinase)
VLGEVDFPPPADWREWAEFEALSDQELTDLPVWSLCMYDRTRLPAEALATGRMTHLIFRDNEEPVPNPDYFPPTTLLGDSEVETRDPLLASPPTLAIADVSHVGPLRHTVRTVLSTMSHMPATVLEDFVLAIHEVVGNGLVHGARPVSVRLWVSSDRAVCSVTDGGTGFSETPGALGRRAMEPPEGPVGLALVGALVDELHSYRTPAGFTVTISISYPAASQEDPLAGNGL